MIKIINLVILHNTQVKYITKRVESLQYRMLARFTSMIAIYCDKRSFRVPRNEIEHFVKCDQPF